MLNSIGVAENQDRVAQIRGFNAEKPEVSAETWNPVAEIQPPNTN
jgi:hypothetical protein